MKKASLALFLILSLALCACGSAPEAAPAPTEAPTAAPAPMETPEASPAVEEEPALILPDAGLHAAEETPREDPELTARRALAAEFLERDVAELIEALGEPLERSYAPSCLGSGEDGELVYEGFTVYTYREGGRETVVDVA